MNRDDLKNYILYLLANNRIEQFYHSAAWKKLKLEVLKFQHYECPECKKENKLTIVNMSDQCHHIKELKEFPELALSMYYVDQFGNKQINLEVICLNCHNKIHNRFQKSNSFKNEEKW